LQNGKNSSVTFHKTTVRIKDTVAPKYKLTRDIHIPNKRIYILLHVIIAFILQSLATFPEPLISVQHKNLA